MGCAKDSGAAGDYCRNDTMCDEGLICVSLECRAPLRQVDSGMREPAPDMYTEPSDLGPPSDSGPEDMGDEADLGGDDLGPDDMGADEDLGPDDMGADDMGADEDMGPEDMGP